MSAKVSLFLFLALAVAVGSAINVDNIIKLTHAVSKATYLPISDKKYLQNGKIFENPSSTKFAARCPYGYPEMDGAICYKPCEKRNGWAFANGIGPVCWGCPSSHPSEEVALCYRNCPADKPHKGAFNCYGNCPSGYRNDGLTCFRDAHIFGSDNSACPWYDICGLTFKRGCSKCPSGYSNDGCTCRKDPHAITRPRYNRGVGVVLKSYGRGVGKALLLFPKYESAYDKPACSLGGWTAAGYVKDDTEVLKFVNAEQRLIVFGFRGTEATNLNDWFKNLDFQPKTSTVGGKTFKAHKGFSDRYNYIASWFESEYGKAIETGYTIILTGHSLGGAEAAIAAVYAAGKLNRRPDAVVTYGAPLVGDSDFVKYYQDNVGCDRTRRFISKSDIVPGMPKVFGYAHICDETYVDGGGDFLQAHDLHVGYQKGIANKYGNNNNDIKEGCDRPIRPL